MAATDHQVAVAPVADRIEREDHHMVHLCIDFHTALEEAAVVVAAAAHRPGGVVHKQVVVQIEEELP